MDLERTDVEGAPVPAERLVGIKPNAEKCQAVVGGTGFSPATYIPQNLAGFVDPVGDALGEQPRPHAPHVSQQVILGHDAAEHPLAGGGHCQGLSTLGRAGVKRR